MPDPTPKTAAKPTAAKPVTAPTPADPLAVPDYTTDPEYAAAAANRVRIQLELNRIELELTDVRARAERAIADRRADARAVLAGGSPSVAPPAKFLEAELDRLQRQRRTCVDALAMADQQVRGLAGEAKRRVLLPYSPAYRAMVREAVVSLIAHARVMAVHDEVNETLGRHESYGYAGLDSPVPRFPHGRLDDPQSSVCQAIRRAIDGGFLDERADAELLAGVMLTPKPVPHVEPKPKEKKKVTWRQAMRSLGISVGWSD